MDPTHETLADRVRRFRKALGLTQEALAELSGMDRTHVVLVEGGRNKLTSFASRQKMCRGLGLSLETFDAYLTGRLSLDNALALSTREPLPKAG